MSNDKSRDTTPRAQIDHSAVDTLEGGDEATGMFDDLVDRTLAEKAEVVGCR